MNLKEHRIKKGLTQRELAAKVGVTDAYICLIEKGARKNPDIALLEKFADVLGIPVTKLLSGKKAG